LFGVHPIRLSMGAFGGYNAETAYGLYYWQTYDGVVAFNAQQEKECGNTKHHQHRSKTPTRCLNAQWVLILRCSMGSRRKNLCLQLGAHSKSTNYPRLGLHCIDAYTGKGIWNITVPCSQEQCQTAIWPQETATTDICTYWQGQSTTTVNCPDVAVPKERSRHKRHSLGPESKSTRNALRFQRLNEHSDGIFAHAASNRRIQP